MNELKRVYGRKMLMLSAVIFTLNFVIFMLSCDGESMVTAEGEELREYISSYAAEIEKTMEESKKLAMLNIYGSGFGSENIAKTAEDFSGLSGITLKFGDNRGIAVFSEYHMTDLIFAAFMIIISAVLPAERKKGLENLIRSTSGGRIKLYFSRIGVLVFSALGAAFFLYGGNILGAYSAYGNMGMTRPIQSVPKFSMCVYRITIFEYIFYSVGIKIIAAISAAVLFFVITGLLGSGGAYIFGGFFAVSEILFYIFIPDASAFNILKFVNIFTAVKTEDYFKIYRNLNIFGKPVSILFAGILFCILIILICFIPGIFIYGKMYPKREHFADRIIIAVRKFFEKHGVCRTLFGWEGYKLIIRQRVGLIIICAFFAAYSQAVKYDYFYPINTYELEWYAKYTGEMTDDMLNDMEKQKARLERSINLYKRRLEELMSREPVDWETYGKIMNFLNEAQARYDSLLPILNNVSDGMDYTKRTGNSLKLIKPYSYDLFFIRDRKTVRRNSLFILIGVICAASGVYSFERENRMDAALRSAYRGRIPLNFCKINWVNIICALLCTAVHFVQLIRIGSQMGFSDLDAPLQSLDFMRAYPLYMPIIRYMAMIFCIRAASACVVGLICAFIGRHWGDRASAIGVCAFAAAGFCLFPQVLRGAEWFSPLFWIGKY